MKSWDSETVNKYVSYLQTGDDQHLSNHDFELLNNKAWHFKNNNLYYNTLKVISNNVIENTFQKLYTNSKVIGGRDKMYYYVKNHYIGISKRNIMNFLKHQTAWQIT